MKFGVVGLILFLGSMEPVLTSHFRGGYITWGPDPNVANQITVTWRLSWRRSSSGTNCDQTTIDSKGVITGDSSIIRCAQQCSPSHVSAGVVCTDFNIQEDWSSGVFTTDFLLQEANNQSATISYIGNAWIDTINGAGGWQLAAHVDLNRRPDNNQINTSPKTIQSPIVYTQQGCPITINIPVVDVDGDIVRCRWAEGESGDLTRPSSDVLTYLDEANCQVTVVYNAGAFIAIALAIEDFIPPYTTTSQPLSTIPLQFLVKVNHLNVNSTLPCNLFGQRPIFVHPSPDDNAVHDVLSGTAINITLRARAIDPSLPITEFSTVSPQGLTKSNLMDAGNNEKLINIRYTPTANQNDTELFCFSAEDGRQSSKQRCISFIIVADEVPPIMYGGPSSINASTDTNSSTATVFWTTPIASDNTGEAVTLISNYVPGDLFSPGITTVTYRAVDINGNTAKYSFDVSVPDVEPPVVFRTPPSQVINTDPGSAEAIVFWTPPMASDNSGKLVTLTSNFSPGDNFTLGTTSVVYTATDNSGNIATYSFAIVVTGKAVRLVGGANANEGRVEVYYNNTWGTVCDDFFDAYDAKVVCRQLDLPHDGAIAYGSSHFGHGSGSILLDDVQCNGNETYLSQCSHSGWDEADCSHDEDAGVTCAYRIHLVGGVSSREGHVEIHVNGSWGTVCDDSWDENDARVVCRQLGFPYDGAIAYTSTRFGQGSGSILLDDVQCTGNESALSLCSHAGWGVSNCRHHEDAGVICGCPSGYKGDRCQNVICHPSCYNGGKCLEPNICTCRGGYHGSRCQNAMCRPLCSNGGTCTGPNICTCQPGYHGDICQYETEPPYTTREFDKIGSLQD